MDGGLAVRHLLNGIDLAHLNAANLNLGVGIHHQAGPRRHHRHRHAVGQATAEEGCGENDHRDHHRDGGNAGQGADGATAHSATIRAVIRLADARDSQRPH